jgi:hypothetical protein
LIVSSEGQIEDKETDDLSVVREKLKVKRQMFVSSGGQIEDKETDDLSVVREKLKVKRQMICQ